MIEKLLDEVYWSELENRLIRLQQIDPYLRILNQYKNTKHGLGILNLVSSNELELIENFNQTIINDESNEGMSRESALDWISENFQIIKGRLILNAKKFLDEKLRHSTIELKDLDYWITPLKFENDIEVLITKYREMVSILENMEEEDI